MYSLHTPAENKDERQREKTDQKGGIKRGQGLNYYEMKFSVQSDEQKGKLLSLLSYMSIKRVMMSQQYFQLQCNMTRKLSLMVNRSIYYILSEDNRATCFNYLVTPKIQETNNVEISVNNRHKHN
jgi:hypothetical protein